MLHTTVSTTLILNNFSFSSDNFLICSFCKFNMSRSWSCSFLLASACSPGSVILVRDEYFFVFCDQTWQIIHLPYFLVEFLQGHLQSCIFLLQLPEILNQKQIGLLLILIGLTNNFLQNHNLPLKPKYFLPQIFLQTLLPTRPDYFA